MDLDYQNIDQLYKKEKAKYVAVLVSQIGFFMDYIS